MVDRDIFSSSSIETSRGLQRLRNQHDDEDEHRGVEEKKETEQQEARDLSHQSNRGPLRPTLRLAGNAGFRGAWFGGRPGRRVNRGGAVVRPCHDVVGQHVRRQLLGGDGLARGFLGKACSEFVGQVEGDASRRGAPW